MEKIKKLLPKDLPFWLFYALMICVIISKLVLGYQQTIHTWIDGAPLDDELMFEAALSISNGEWLGAYNWLTLSKQMFFAVWLAFCNLINIPYLVMGQALLCLSALFAMHAFSPVLDFRWKRFLLFAAICYNPASSAAFTLRVYRDNIFPSLCILFFIGIIGAALRYKKSAKQTLPWLFLSGIGLGLAQITREDGIWLFPFAIVANAVVLWYIIKDKTIVGKISRCVSLIVPYAVTAVCISTMSAMNLSHYGVFTTSDFQHGSFVSAYGAMTRIEHENPHSLVPVPTDVREKLYVAVPELEPLRYWLEEYEPIMNSYRNPKVGDYQAGAFYWALRHCAQQEGVYDSAQTAENYWQTVADGINGAIESGVLTASVGERNTTTPIIKFEYVLPTLRETLYSFVHVLAFWDTEPYYPSTLSLATPEDALVWEEYLGSLVSYRAVAGQAIPYYNPLQLLVYKTFEILNVIFRGVFLSFFILACFNQCKKLLDMIKTKSTDGLFLWLILFGVLSMAILRCAMISFMEVAAFNIGTSTMYLSTVHPLLIIYAVVGALGEDKTNTSKN